MQFSISTKKKVELVDITSQIEYAVERSGVKSGACVVHAPHATVAIVLNEFEPNLQRDFEQVFEKMLPKMDYAHDHIDNNALSHLLSGLIGSGRTIPIEDGKLALGTWQRIIVCELDGPRSNREIVVSILKSQ
ncbi:YjbQ family protein [Candidatus Micrarchaeota archaeon]|nr:YjbQ family protein [Candidatus Micrarchaeota archaeon]